MKSQYWLPKKFFDRAVWWPAPPAMPTWVRSRAGTSLLLVRHGDARKLAWVSNGHFIVLADRAPWLEPRPEQQGIVTVTRWRRLPPKNVRAIRGDLFCPADSVRRVLGHDRDYVSGPHVTRVQKCGRHVYNTEYLALIARAWPGCEWRTRRTEDAGSSMAWALRDGRVVGLVMSMGRERAR